MHHRDLAGRPAEVDAADLEPDLEGLAEGRRLRADRCAGGFELSSCSRRLGRPVVPLLRGKAQIREQRIVDHEAAVAAGHDRRRRRAPTVRARSRAGRRPPARDRAARCRRRARSAPAAPATVRSSSPNSLSMVSNEQRSPSCEISTPSMSNGMAPVSLRDRRHLGRIDKQDARVGIDEAADQPRAGDAVDLRPPPRHPQARPLRREAVERGFVDQRQAWLRSRPHSRRPARCASIALRRADRAAGIWLISWPALQATRPGASRSSVGDQSLDVGDVVPRPRPAARPAPRHRHRARRVSTICGALRRADQIPEIVR